MNSNSSAEDKCHYCLKECKLLRCSQCKITKYCSKSCQKKDWKSSHRLQCIKFKPIDEIASTSSTNPSFEVQHPVHEKDAKKAAAELMGLVSSMKVQEATEQFYKVSDEITSTRIRLNREEKGDDNDNGNGNNKREEIASEINDGQDNSGLQSADSLQDALHLQEITTALQSTSFNEGDWDYAIEKLIYISSFGVTVIPPTFKTGTIYKHDVQVTLSSSSQSPSSSVNNRQETRRYCIETIVQITNQHKTSSGENEMKILATFKVPLAILSTEEDIRSSLQVDDKNVLSFRMQYHDAGQAQIDSIIPESTNVLTPVGALNNLQCKSCQQYLLLNPWMVQGFTERKGDDISKNGEGREESQSSAIHNVFHLPTGHWDEITDYLTCYEGQPAIDFSSVSNVAERGNVFEDKSILVMNQKDLLNVCILAIDGYGENVDNESDNESNNQGAENVTFRGNRDWRDAVGGATLTCNQCCATLGFASIVEPDACRLLKHKLRATSKNDADTDDGHGQGYGNCGEGKDHFEHHSCGSFVGKEIVRYSESQAVFTFAVYGNFHERMNIRKSNGNDHGRVMGDCLLIKVLSWNSLMAIKTEGGSVCFRRAVKVIYEEQDAAFMRSMNSAEKNASDPTLFQWGGIDLCCPPNQMEGAPLQTQVKNQSMPIAGENDTTADASSNEARASVNLYLSHDEWEELRDVLQWQSKYFSAATSQATVSMKLGAGGEMQGGKARLSFLSF